MDLFSWQNDSSGHNSLEAMANVIARTVQTDLFGNPLPSIEEVQGSKPQVDWANVIKRARQLLTPRFAKAGVVEQGVFNPFPYIRTEPAQTFHAISSNSDPGYLGFVFVKNRPVLTSLCLLYCIKTKEFALFNKYKLLAIRTGENFNDFVEREFPAIMKQLSPEEGIFFINMLNSEVRKLIHSEVPQLMETI